MTDKEFEEKLNGLERQIAVMPQAPVITIEGVELAWGIEWNLLLELIRRYRRKQ